MVLVLLCTAGCKKTAAVNTYRFSASGLAYVQLPAGKHYIYLDSAVNRLDTITVTTSLIQSYTGHIGSIAYIGERYNFTLSLQASDMTSVWLSGNADSYNFSTIYLIPDTGSGYLFRYPPCDCGSVENIPSVVEQTIPAMTVEGKTYTQVVATINVNAANQQSSYYWAGGAGLIKRVEVTPAVSSTYTLVKSY